MLPYLVDAARSFLIPWSNVTYLVGINVNPWLYPTYLVDDKCHFWPNLVYLVDNKCKFDQIWPIWFITNVSFDQILVIPNFKVYSILQSCTTIPFITIRSILAKTQNIENTTIRSIWSKFDQFLAVHLFFLSKKRCYLELYHTWNVVKSNVNKLVLFSIKIEKEIQAEVFFRQK